MSQTAVAICRECGDRKLVMYTRRKPIVFCNHDNVDASGLEAFTVMKLEDPGEA